MLLLRIFHGAIDTPDTTRISIIVLFLHFFSFSCLREIIERRQSICEVSYTEAKNVILNFTFRSSMYQSWNA